MSSSVFRIIPSLHILFSSFSCFLSSPLSLLSPLFLLVPQLLRHPGGSSFIFVNPAIYFAFFSFFIAFISFFIVISAKAGTQHQPCHFHISLLHPSLDSLFFIPLTYCFVIPVSYYSLLHLSPCFVPLLTHYYVLSDVFSLVLAISFRNSHSSYSSFPIFFPVIPVLLVIIPAPLVVIPLPPYFVIPSSFHITPTSFHTIPAPLVVIPA